MDFYPMDEDTPLLRDMGGPDASPHDSVKPASYPVATKSRDSSATPPNQQTTELELNVDKISVLFSPTARQDANTFNNYKSFAEIPPNGSLQNHDELNMLDPYFDVTPPRLRVAFEGAGPEKNGELGYNGFRAALENLGIRCPNDVVFLKLVQNIDREKSGRITLQQFDAAVHHLKMMHMFDENAIQEMESVGYRQAGLSVSDFSGTKLQTFALRQKQLQSFFTAHRPEWVNVRWINLDGRNSLNLKRLAIKYRLHPLAIEDTIEGHERPKFDRYDGHLFLVFPVLRMQVMPDKGLPLERKRSRFYSDTRETLMSNFVKRMSFRRSACTLPIDDTDDNDEDPLKLWIEHVFIFVVDNDTVITVKDGEGSNIWTELNRRLAVPYSKLRHNDAKFLVYSVLDVIVDQVTSVVDAVTECLIALENQLEQERHRFEMRSLRVLKNELFRLPRLLKPAREVLKNIIESKDFDASVTDYVRDVHDHVVAALDDIEQQLQMCRQLTEEYRDAKSTQMNYVIYTLTVVTTVFLPGQFLTGVYGMNFDDMPELHERYGYALFWVFAITIAAALQLYFRHKQWI